METFDLHNRLDEVITLLLEIMSEFNLDKEEIMEMLEALLYDETYQDKYERVRGK